MITYGYWVILIVVSFVVFMAAHKAAGNKTAVVFTVITLLLGWSMHEFYFEQIFVKRWGGTMSISTPTGEMHIGATWKDDNLWINTFDPKTNKCYFREISRGNVLQGQVVISDCSPLLAK